MFELLAIFITLGCWFRDAGLVPGFLYMLWQVVVAFFIGIHFITLFPNNQIMLKKQIIKSFSQKKTVINNKVMLWALASFASFILANELLIATCFGLSVVPVCLIMYKFQKQLEHKSKNS